MLSTSSSAPPLLASQHIRPAIATATRCRGKAHRHLWPPAAGVLICGGGPAGYTTAIALAQQGYQGIHILEQAPGASFFDSSKAFTFALSREGKGVLRRQGVAGIDSFGLCLNGMSMKMVHPDSKIEQKVMMKAKEDMDDEHANTWLPRHVLNSKLCEHVLQHHSGAVTVRSSLPVSEAASARSMQALGARAHTQQQRRMCTAARACALAAAQHGRALKAGCSLHAGNGLDTQCVCR